MIVVSTSRRPNPRLRSFAKDLARALPKAIKLNRGKLSISALAQHAYEVGADLIILVNRGSSGNPGRIFFIKILEGSYVFFPLILRISGVKLLREEPAASPIEKVETACIIYGGDSGELSNLVEGLSTILNIPFYNVPKPTMFRREYDIIILVEKISKGYSIKFLNSRNLLPAGPKIRVDKVFFHKPYP